MPILANPYGFLIKLGLVIAFAIGLFGFGYYEGYKHTSNAEKAAVVRVVQVQTKALPKEEAKIAASASSVKTVHDKVYVYVTKTVPDNRVCDVPAATVGMLNANRSLPAAP